MRFIIFFMISWLILASRELTVFAAQETIGNTQDFRGQLESPKKIGTDFETYKNAIDDLFFTALITSPDSEHGINEMIIGLNRKLTGKPDDPETLISLGHIYRNLKLPKEANKFYEKALALKPDSFHLYCFSAMMYYQMRNFGKALEQLNHSIEINPADMNAWLARGRTLIQLKDDAEAALSYEKAIELDPQNTEALFSLGVLYGRAGKLDDALKLFESLLEKKSNIELAKYHLGLIHLKKHETEKGIQLWEELFYDGIRDPEFLLGLALAYLENKDYTKVETLLKQLQFLYPRALTIQFFQGEVYRQMKRFAEAERAYRLVLAENPDYLNAYIGLAVTLAEKGDKEDGIKILDEAMGRFLDSDKEELRNWKILLGEKHKK